MRTNETSPHGKKEKEVGGGMMGKELKKKKGNRSYRGREEVNIHLFAGVVQTNTADSKHTNTAGISLTHRLVSTPHG